METKGQRIKRIRMTRGLSQRQLADRVGVDPISVSRWECDKQVLRPERREQIAVALGVSEAVIEGFEDPQISAVEELARTFSELLRNALDGRKSEWDGTERRRSAQASR